MGDASAKRASNLTWRSKVALFASPAPTNPMLVTVLVMPAPSFPKAVTMDCPSVYVFWGIIEHLQTLKICRAPVSWFTFNSIRIAYIAFPEPPSAPQNLTVNFVDQSNVILSWLPPESLGGRSDIAYRIKCDVCSASGGLVQYNPPMVNHFKLITILN